MNIKNWLTSKVAGLVLGRWIDPLIVFLRGKKTYLGLLQIFLALLLMAGMAYPDMLPAADAALWLANYLSGAGLDMSDVLAIAQSGAGWTVIGLIDKIIRLIKPETPPAPPQPKLPAVKPKGRK